MINRVYLIFFLLINSVEAISSQGATVIREMQEYDDTSKSGDKLDLRIAQIEFIYAVKAWEKMRGIKYSLKLKKLQDLFNMYRRLIATRRII